jgi:nitroreductase
VPDMIDLLKTRRSVKPIEMTGPGPSPAEIETILTLGARVPDHGKLVPWRFIVFEGDARARAGDIFAAVFKEQNLAATADQVEAERKKFMHAPLVIGVVSRARPHVKIPIWEQELSAGASTMNIVLAANALGYAANWLTGWAAFDRSVLDALGLAADEKMAGFVHIGRAKRPPEERDRPQIETIVTRF